MPISNTPNFNFPVPGGTTDDDQLQDLAAIKNAIVAIDTALHNVNVNTIVSETIDTINNSPISLEIIGSNTISSEFPNIYSVELTQLGSTKKVICAVTTTTPGVTIDANNVVVIDTSMANSTPIRLTAKLIYNGQLYVANLITVVTSSGSPLSVNVVAPYYGVAAIPGAINSVFVKSLSSRGVYGSRANNHFSLEPGIGQYMWYAYPVSLGEATFVDLSNGFEGGWEGATGTGPLTVTVDGISFYVYRSDNSNLGYSDIQVY